MFQEIVGSILLVFTAGLLVKYRPKTFLSWYSMFALRSHVYHVHYSGWWFMGSTTVANSITNDYGNMSVYPIYTVKSICGAENKIIARTETTRTQAMAKAERIKTSKMF